jgi:hypothetical protein
MLTRGRLCLTGITPEDRDIQKDRLFAQAIGALPVDKEVAIQPKRNEITCKRRSRVLELIIAMLGGHGRPLVESPTETENWRKRPVML